MTAKKGAKIDIGKVAEDVEKIDFPAEGVDILSIAGVVKGFKLKHSDIGSGFVFKGKFAGWGLYSGDEHIDVDSLTLPIDIGLKIAKACKAAGKNAVRFAVTVKAKKTTMLAQGYLLQQSWGTEPEELGQKDIIKDMLEKLKPT